jgi:hypothetical protein
MIAAADWLVVVGFFLAGLGLTLRIIVLMRSNDAQPPDGPALYGRQLLRAYRESNPKSKLLTSMWSSLGLGLILLIAGFLLELR